MGRCEPRAWSRALHEHTHRNQHQARCTSTQVSARVLASQYYFLIRFISWVLVLFISWFASFLGLWVWPGLHTGSAAASDNEHYMNSTQQGGCGLSPLHGLPRWVSPLSLYLCYTLAGGSLY